MSRELANRLARIEATRGARRVFIEERHPDGTRSRISGEGEPRSSDLVITVIRRFEDLSETTNPKPKEA